jgi:hypothetical protein
MKLLFSYISQRFKPLQFIVLACLLSLLVYNTASEIGYWLNGIGFLFTSFFAFRFLDDVFSVHIDRKEHPERDYLNVKNYATFVILSACIMPFYLITLFYLEWPWINMLWIVLLIIVSVVLYTFFGKNTKVMTLIPLLKYPVLLAALYEFPGNFLPEIFASFFVVLIYELAEDNHRAKSTFWWLLLVELVCGLLLFKDLNPALFILFLAAPIVQTVLAQFFKPSTITPHLSNMQYSGYRYLHIQLIIYYPITYFIFTYFS